MNLVHGADSVKLDDYILIELSFVINCFLQMHPNNFIINEIMGTPLGATVFPQSAYKKGKSKLKLL